MTLEELQAFKKDAYKQINWDVKQGQSKFAEAETRAALARSARKEIEKHAPDVKEINAREGRLLELDPELTQSARRIENRDIVGLGLPMKAIAGDAAAGGTGTLIGATAGLLDMPKPKAALALELERLRRNGLLDQMVDNSLVGSLLTQSLFQSGRASRE